MKFDIETEMWPLERIIPYDRNPKKHSEVQIEKLARHIAEVGWDQAIVVDEHNVILKGHGRLQVAYKLGLKEAPVIVKKGLSASLKRAVRIADNKLGESPWIPELLKLELEEIEYNEISELEPLGFEPHELKDLFEKKIDPIDTGEKDDETPEEPGIPFVKPHDVWRIGNHLLVCDDSRNPVAAARLFEEDLQIRNTALMFTDPPYGVKYDADWRKDHSNSVVENVGSLKNDDIADWTEVFTEWKPQVVYCWHDAKLCDVAKKMLTDGGLEIRNQIIWNKSIHAISRGDYHWKHESCWYAVRKGMKSNWSGKRDQTTIWDCPPPHAYNSEEEHTGHPSQKPLALAIKAIMNHEFDVVMDPFLGSGTTLIAAEKTGKTCYGMEIDPKFCCTIINRYISFVGSSDKVFRVESDDTLTPYEKVVGEIHESE